MKNTILFKIALFTFSLVFPSLTFAQDPVSYAKYTSEAIKIDGDLSETPWSGASAFKLEKVLQDGKRNATLSTTVRVLYSKEFLYIAYEAPYTKLTVYDPPIKAGQGERVGLWNADVVEVFINAKPERPKKYAEFQVAPTGEKLDLLLNLPEKDFLWDSGFEAAVKIDEEKKLWTTELRIPMKAFSDKTPQSGERWRINYYRHDIASGNFLSWTPTMNPSAHIPEKFGVLEFSE